MQIAVGVVAIILVIVGITRLVSRGSNTELSTGDTTHAVVIGNYPGYADSLKAIKEDIAVARVELNRADPDYAAANKSLSDGDKIMASLPASAAADTTVARLKIQLAAQRSAVVKACDAMKRVAQQRGEPLPNCGT